jgi:hypothetical protein
MIASSHQGIVIRSHNQGEIIYRGEHASLRDAVAAAARAGVCLTHADLEHACLPHVELAGVDLKSACFRHADLAYADLRGANLEYANLGHANLNYADLTGADLGHAIVHGAGLQVASLAGARINWESHALISTILLEAAGLDVERRKVAGLVRVSPGWCWETWLGLRADPNYDWALDTLARAVRPGDNAPAALVAWAERLPGRPGGQSAPAIST